ncbi:MAG: hypothetical protein PWQ57_1259 [Desulfovibrionales bacterium]|nr:hypothetical protein [Desulfovibrionales bacterium]
MDADAKGVQRSKIKSEYYFVKDSYEKSIARWRRNATVLSLPFGPCIPLINTFRNMLRYPDQNSDILDNARITFKGEPVVDLGSLRAALFPDAGCENACTACYIDLRSYLEEEKGEEEGKPGTHLYTIFEESPYNYIGAFVLARNQAKNINPHASGVLYLVKFNADWLNLSQYRFTSIDISVFHPERDVKRFDAVPWKKGNCNFLSSIKQRDNASQPDR